MRNQRASHIQTKAHALRAVGYIRVSTEHQALEGVSLEAQRVRIEAHCVSQQIELVDVVMDDGYSAKSLQRPGLHAVLEMLNHRQAEAIIVVKLDRLTRSVKDLSHLCDTYFREGMPFYLMSVSDAIDTRSASGKLILNVLMSVAQWEREAITERTQEAMDELKRQGVQLGTPPYGWRYSKDRNEQGRRYLVEVPEEQRGIRRVCELYDADVRMRDICTILVHEGIPPRKKLWHVRSLHRILERAGYEDPDRPRKTEPSRLERMHGEQATIKRDKSRAVQRATELRAQGLSLRQIGERLQGEGIFPARGNRWHAASVLDLLRSAE